MRKRARLAPVVWVCALAAALLAAAWVTSRAARQAIALQQLQQAGDSELPSLLRQAMQTTSTGMELCVLALQSPRGPQIAAAREVLFEEMARWQLLSDAEAARRRQLLATQLAEQAELLSDDGRLAASEIATQLLSSSTSVPLSQRSTLTLACEEILRARLAYTDRSPAVLTKRRRSTPVRTASWTAAPATEAIQVRISATTPPERLPDSLVDHPVQRLGQSDEEAAATDMPEAPAPVARTAHAPKLLPSDMSHAMPIDEPIEPAMLAPVVEDRVAEKPPLQGYHTHQAPSPSHVADDDRQSQMQTMQLVERLHAPGTTAERARQELERRGLTPAELEIAQRLSDPDPAIRLRWLEALPGLPHMDARPWLLWLSRDADADVRLAALSIMATSGEPDMMRRVAEMAREDLEPRVKQRATDIQRQLERAGRAGR